MNGELLVRFHYTYAKNIWLRWNLKHRLTSNSALNVLIYGSLCTSMMALQCVRKKDQIFSQYLLHPVVWRTGIWLWHMNTLLFLVRCGFIGLVQSIFNCNKIQNNSLTPDNVLNILINGSHVLPQCSVERFIGPSKIIQLDANNFHVHSQVTKSKHQSVPVFSSSDFSQSGNYFNRRCIYRSRIFSCCICVAVN